MSIPWDRSHDAHIERECEGLEEYTGDDIIGAWILHDGSIGTCPYYLTDPAAAIRAAEAWRKKADCWRSWSIRSPYGQDQNQFSADVLQEHQHERADRYQAEANDFAAALAQALYRATGGPA